MRAGRLWKSVLNRINCAVNNAPSSPSPSPPCWPCPSLLLPSPAAAVEDEDGQKTSLPWQRHHRYHPIDQHCRMTAASPEEDDSHFNAAFAAAVNTAAATTVAAAVTIAFAAVIAAVLALSAAITVVVVATIAAATATAAAANAVTTNPSPLPLLSLLLQPPSTSLHLRRSCQWLVVVSSVTPCLLRCPLSKFVSPPRPAVVHVDNYCRHQRLPSPLPQSTTTTSKSQRLSFVFDGGNDNHHRLQRRLMATAAMKSLPPPSTTTTGWWPTARRCRRRQCCHHHALALASAVTITAAFAIGIAPPTLLSMVSCCVICCPLPAALSAVQICQPLPSCGALSTGCVGMGLGKGLGVLLQGVTASFLSNDEFGHNDGNHAIVDKFLVDCGVFFTPGSARLVVLAS